MRYRPLHEFRIEGVMALLSCDLGWLVSRAYRRLGLKCELWGLCLRFG